MAGEGGNLCLAGGLAMNALLVESLESSGKFDGVFVQPAAGNSGTALGAVFEAWHGIYNEKRRASLGQPVPGAELLRRADQAGAGELQAAVPLPADDRGIDRHRGGAAQRKQDRGLDARPHGIRPARAGQSQHSGFAARSVLDGKSEHLHQAPGIVSQVRGVGAGRTGGRIFRGGPERAVSGDGGARARALPEMFRERHPGRDLIRVHAVSEEDNPLYWKLLHAAGKKTGLPVLYNTSFNLFGEPLVCTPRDAVRSFYSSGIDAMFVGNFFLQK